ncbi:hypothetical protein BH09VER1_BH09VER1_09600 [soil metagenome]
MKARFLFGLVLLASCLGRAEGATQLPPSPVKYVTDTAGVLSSATVSSLNTKLENFEKETSNQVVVYLMPEVPSDYALEDFTQRTFASWGVGQKEKNNGVVLFVFPKSRKMRIEVGYGLEGVLPDARAKQIIENQIKPAFKRGDFNAGVTRGVEGILGSLKGEYKGTGVTHYQQTHADSIGEVGGSLSPLLIPLGFFVLFVVTSLVSAMRRGTSYSSRRRSDSWFIPPIGGGSSGDSFFGGSSGGGGDSGGGGFSGGGGDSGGGGASGSW